MRTVWPACSAREASSVASLEIASASRSTSRRNAWGVCARKIVRRSSVARTKEPSTCLTVSRAATAASAAPLSAAAAIVFAINVALANGRAASCTTHDVRPVGHHLEGRGHGVLPARAAGDDAERLRGVREIRRRLLDQVGRQRDHHLVDLRVRQKNRQAALEHRATADLQQLLGLRVTEPQTASAGREDR